MRAEIHNRNKLIFVTNRRLCSPVAAANVNIRGRGAASGTSGSGLGTRLGFFPPSASFSFTSDPFLLRRGTVSSSGRGRSLLLPGRRSRGKRIVPAAMATGVRRRPKTATFTQIATLKLG